MVVGVVFTVHISTSVPRQTSLGEHKLILQYNGSFVLLTNNTFIITIHSIHNKPLYRDLVADKYVTLNGHLYMLACEIVIEQIKHLLQLLNIKFLVPFCVSITLF